jgi:DNA-binding response OmpR family regulator
LKKKGFEVEIALSSKAALACLDLFTPDVVIVDAASLKTSGRRICSTLRQWDDELPIILIMDSDHLETPKAAANVVLTWPFTLQKLVNRMRPFLPAEGKNVLRLGPIRLDLDERRVLCLGSSANLTPLLMKLLKVLMEHHGEVVERHELFRQVWDTEYTADTRTLDVHISWLRQAIEMDPRHPRFLKTVRGVGYRLDVEQR